MEEREKKIVSWPVSIDVATPTVFAADCVVMERKPRMDTNKHE
jgi:hypothetical protein